MSKKETNPHPIGLLLLGIALFGLGIYTINTSYEIVGDIINVNIPSVIIGVLCFPISAYSLSSYRKALINWLDL